MSHAAILVDTGLMVAFYEGADRYHSAVVEFFSTCTSQLITTVGCVTEVMRAETGFLGTRCWRRQSAVVPRWGGVEALGDGGEEAIVFPRAEALPR